MSPELDKQLCEKYPKIFRDRNGDMKETLMCWGFECGDGWYTILDQLCANIQWHIDQRNKTRDILLKGNPHNVPIPDKVPQVVAMQVKEKFGGLRFYYNGGDEVVGGMIRMAKSWADNTCEVCGNPGKSRDGGWIRTLCDIHHEAENN